MRVRATATFTAIRECQLLTFNEGDEISGDLANYLLSTGAAVESVDSEQEPGDTLDIDGKIEDILAWVGDDPERAIEAHTAEEAKEKPRSTLLAKLAELVDQA